MSEEAKAYKTLMESRAVLWESENTFGRLPDDFLTTSPSEQRKNAITIIRAEKEKSQALINLAIEHLHKATGSYSTVNFRSPQSLGIQQAADRAFDAQGVELHPLGAGPSCDCGNGAEHKIVEIEVTAHGICRTLKESTGGKGGGLADL
jgi:hypothetical protein